MISKNNIQLGGHVTHRKIVNNRRWKITNKKISNKSYMQNNNNITYDDFLNILNTITISELSYINFKTIEEQYRKLLKDNYDDIALIIEKLKVFAEPFNSNDINYVKKLYNNLISINQFKNKYQCCTQQDNYFIDVLNTLLPILDKHQDYSFVFLDVLYNFDKYNININDESEKIFTYIRRKYDRLYEDSYDETEGNGSDDMFDVPPITENDIKLFDLIHNEVNGVEKEKSELRNKIKIEEETYYNFKKKKIKTYIDYDNEQNKDKNVANIIKAYQKYIKYKLKYLQLQK